jgi:capsular polysaccharide biosynthesis protein
MSDCLPRIWKTIEASPAAKILLHETFQYMGFVTQSLALLNIQPTYFFSRENLFVEKLILTSRTANFPNFNEPPTRLTREKLAPKVSNIPFRRVYISRKLADKRKAHNELAVELLMRKHGFEIVHPENISLKAKIELMAETQILVSLHGAALTNMLFMQ